jgi:hypothetical protein
MGVQDDKNYPNYHRVLNRAKWSGLAASKILLGLLVAAFCGVGLPLVLGVDETIERRQGEKIKAQGVFRDALRSSKKHLVKCFGLRWVSIMVIVPVPWSERVWALPFLTLLAPSEASNRKNGKRHKTSLDWIAQMISAVQRWLPLAMLVLVTDGGLAAVQLGLHCRQLPNPVTYISRLRLNAICMIGQDPRPRASVAQKPRKAPSHFPSTNVCMTLLLHGSAWPSAAMGGRSKPWMRSAEVAFGVSIQPPANLTGTFRGAVCLQVTSETWAYGKCRSSFVQPE